MSEKDPVIPYHLSDRLYNQRTFYLVLLSIAITSSGTAMMTWHMLGGG